MTYFLSDVPPRRWLSLPFILTLAVPALLAQGHLRFVADIHTGGSITGAGVPMGMPEIAVELAYLDPIAGLQQTQLLTDADGLLPVPPGVSLIAAYVSLEGPRVSVFKSTITNVAQLTYLPSMHHFFTFLLSGTPSTGLITLRLDQAGLPWPWPQPYTKEECNAYYHAWWNLDRLTNRFGGALPNPPLEIVFEPTTGQPDIAVNWGPSPAGGAGPHLRVRVPGPHALGPIATSTNPRANSETIIAHECAHTLIGLLPAPYRHVEEAVADYMAAAVTANHIIGDGVTPRWRTGPFGNLVQVMPRDLSDALPWSPVEVGVDPYARSRSLSGALWQADRTGAAGALSSHLLAALDGLSSPQAATTGDVLLMIALLLADDDDGTLSNGTPSSAAMFTAFPGRRGYPWPLPGYAARVGVGFGSAVGSPAPELHGTSGAVVGVHATHLPELMPGFFAFSQVPAAALPVTAGPSVFLDADSLFLAPFVTDATGQAMASFAVPSGMQGTMVGQAAAFGGTGVLGLAVANGLHLAFAN